MSALSARPGDEREALELLFYALRGEGRTWHPVEWHERTRLRPLRRVCWLRGQTRHPRFPAARGFVETLERLAWEGEPLVSAVPVIHHRRFLPYSLPTVLWARLETGRSVELLERFTPQPTLVLQEGATVRRVAFWALRRPLSVEQAERANKRISFALDTRRRDGEVGFRFHPPGTVLRHGRDRPVPIVVAGGTGVECPAGQVVRRLKDPPEPVDPSKWRR